MRAKSISLIPIAQRSRDSTEVSKTSAYIIFEPIGNTIPEILWPKISVTLIITTLFAGKMYSEHIQH